MERTGVTVYMESTPNPAAMKFVTNVLLLPAGDKEYTDKTKAIECPLAFQLFDFTGVKGVFISSSFVTVIKHEATDWFEIQGMIREFIRGFLVSGEDVFLKNAFNNTSAKQNETKAENTIAPQVEVSLSETEEKIVALLEEYVKPAVEQDGGAIDFKSYKEGIVTVTLRGSCSGCPSSVVTLKSGIERLLKQMIPEVQEVVAED